MAERDAVPPRAAIHETKRAAGGRYLDRGACGVAALGAAARGPPGRSGTPSLLASSGGAGAGRAARGGVSASGPNAGTLSVGVTETVAGAGVRFDCICSHNSASVRREA